MSALTDYISQVQRLLHDSNAQFWSVAELTDYINEGRRQLVADTGCYRLLQTPGYLSIGVESYTFGGVTGFNIVSGGSGYNAALGVLITGGGGSGATGIPERTNGVVTSITLTSAGTGYTSAPTVSFFGNVGSGAVATASVLLADTFDLVNMTLYWGASRIVLPYMPWSRFNARMRYWTNYQGRPTVCSVYNNTTVFVQPLPDQAYVVDWDTIVVPPALSTATVEVIPELFRVPVQYYAAYKAKAKEQSWGEAEAFMKNYRLAASNVLRQSFTRRLANPYHA